MGLGSGGIKWPSLSMAFKFFLRSSTREVFYLQLVQHAKIEAKVS
jgi:hypothetical protein